MIAIVVAIVPERGGTEWRRTNNNNNDTDFSKIGVYSSNVSQRNKSVESGCSGSRIASAGGSLALESFSAMNDDDTYTIRFGCDGEPNNIPIREGNSTGKFNVLMRHYNPSEMVSNGVEGYDATKSITKVK